MDEKSLLERVKRGNIAAKKLKACLIQSIADASPKNETKPQKQERERVANMIDKTPDDLILADAKTWLEAFCEIKRGEKKFASKISEAVKNSMQSVMANHAANYANKRTPAVAYFPGAGSERLEKKLEKCSSERCARETLYEMLDLIFESSKASFETMKEELVKEVKKSAQRIYLGDTENKPEKFIADVVEKKLTYYSDAEGKAGEKIPSSNTDPMALQSLSRGDLTRIMLFMFYPEIVNALLKYPELQGDAKVNEYLSEISTAFMKMPTLPQAVTNELLKPLSFGEFLYTKLSLC